MTEERTGEAFELGEQLTVIGSKVRPGIPAPDFALDYLNPTDQSMTAVRLADPAGTVRLLNVVSSLDTPVCHVETRRREELRGAMPASSRVYAAARSSAARTAV